MYIFRFGDQAYIESSPMLCVLSSVETGVRQAGTFSGFLSRTNRS